MFAVMLEAMKQELDYHCPPELGHELKTTLSLRYKPNRCSYPIIFYRPWARRPSWPPDIHNEFSHRAFVAANRTTLLIIDSIIVQLYN